MKKAISLLLALVLCLSLCACRGGDNSIKTTESINSVNTSTTEEVEAQATTDTEPVIHTATAEEVNGEATGTQIIDVEITLENWEEYFDIRPYETKTYNAFGELERESTGEAIYLREEYLEQLHPDSPNVSFKIRTIIEYWECDDNEELLEDGRLGKTENKDEVYELIDYRTEANSDTRISTLNGQIVTYGFSSAPRGCVQFPELGFEIGTEFISCYGGFEILDVIGVLKLIQ